MNVTNLFDKSRLDSLSSIKFLFNVFSKCIYAFDIISYSTLSGRENHL